MFGGVGEHRGVLRFEMNTKIVDEQDKSDRVGNRGEEFVFGDEEKGAAQWGALNTALDWL